MSTNKYLSTFNRSNVILYYLITGNILAQFYLAVNKIHIFFYYLKSKY